MLSYIFSFVTKNTSELLNIFFIGGYFILFNEPKKLEKNNKIEFICDPDTDYIIFSDNGNYKVSFCITVVEEYMEQNILAIYFLSKNADTLEVKCITGSNDLISFNNTNDDVNIRSKYFAFGELTVDKI